MSNQMKQIMPESRIESIFREEIKRLGGKAYKFTSPGNDGVPDRLVCLPGGRAIFVELKTAVGKLTRLQKLQIDFLIGLGFEVFILRGTAGLSEFFGKYGFTESADKMRKYTDEYR